MVPGVRLARRVYSSSAFRWWREQSTSVESQSKGKDMQLTIERAYELVTSHGVFARDYCDRCGRVLGAVRFTRNGEAGEWCSRECREDAQRHGSAKGGVRESIGTSKSGGPPKPGNRGIIEMSPCGKGPPAGCQKQATYRREHRVSRLSPSAQSVRPPGGYELGSAENENVFTCAQ